MTDVPELPNLLIDFEFEAKLVRIVENVIIPSRLKITADVMDSGDGDDEDVEVAFTKIKFWFENIVSRCVAFSRDNRAAHEIVLTDDGSNRTGNILMLTPDDPGDEHLAPLFQSKMTALSAGALVFANVAIKSDNVSGLTFTFVADPESVLPNIDDWIGPHRFFDKPWWQRDDASTLDIPPSPDADLTKSPPWAYSLDFIAQVIKPNTAATEQNAIIRPTFRPTIIAGGKKDDDEH